METATINIKGMTCSGCVNSVTRVLQLIEGVSSVAVSLEKNNAVISYDASRANPAQFKTAIKDAGYDVAD